MVHWLRYLDFPRGFMVRNLCQNTECRYRRYVPDKKSPKKQMCLASCVDVNTVRYLSVQRWTLDSNVT